MIRILKYELYKIFSKKIIWFAALFFIAVIFLSTSQSYTFGDPTEFYNDYYRGNEGAVTELDFKDSDDYLQKDLKLPTDSNKKIEFYRNYDYKSDVYNAYYFSQERLEKIDALKSLNVENAEKYGENSYEYRYGKLHTEMQSSTSTPGVYFTVPWEKPIDFPNNLGLVTFAAMILLGISPVFSQEYSTGADSLLLTSKNGKNKLTVTKVLACVIYCVAVSVFFFGVLFLINFSFSGVMGSGSPIQSIYKYINSPFAFTLLQYFFVEIAVVIFTSVCFGLLVLFVSSVSKNSLIPFFACGLIIATPAVYLLMDLNIQGAVGHVLDCIVNFSYCELMRVSSLFTSFKAFNIFGFPILSCFVIPFVIFLITVALVTFTFKTYKNHQVN